MATIPTLKLDPCGRAEALRAIRDEVLSGGAIVEGEIEQGNGTRRRMKFSPANLDLLNREIIAADEACALLSGAARPGRFAIGGRMS